MGPVHLAFTSLPKPSLSAAYCSRLCLPGAALPLSPQNGAWRDLFMRELVLRKNWRSGTCWTWARPGHTRSVVSVSVRGSVLASGSLDRSIKLWDLRSGQVLRTLRGHQVGLQWVLCNPLQLLTSLVAVSTCHAQRGVWALCFHGRNLLVSGSHDHTIKVHMYVCKSTALALTLEASQ